MYSRPPVHERILANFHVALKLHGYMMVGKAETLQDLEFSYRPVELGSMIGPVSTVRQQVTLREVPWLQHELEQARRELETAYEELQSTVEELETMNEELQSTNEELETMNEELHSTNEELETMNDEMRERTRDAVRAYAFLRSILTSVLQPLVVLDRELRVTAWSAASAELWGLREDEVEGGHFFNLELGLPIGELRPAIRAVLTGNQPDPVVVEGHDRRGRAVRCPVSFSPLQGPAGESLGVILVMDVEAPTGA